MSAASTPSSSDSAPAVVERSPTPPRHEGSPPSQYKTPPTFQLSTLTPDYVSFRRAAFIGLVLLITAVGAYLLFKIFEPNGISVLEGIQMVLFVILTSQLATGFTLAFFGFLQWLLGGDPVQIMNTLPPDESEWPELDRVAVAMPVFNEDIDRILRGLENMFHSAEGSRLKGKADFFILSDSNTPENWLKEECAWLQICQRLDAFGRIFYRKRRSSPHGKSGNVADFCRRWGRRYRCMILLDADSIMTADVMERLVLAMQINPHVGIIQTCPNMVLGDSLFRRLQQFSARLYGSAFVAGFNYWQMGGGNYWGHNAIIRLQPFIDDCDLPELPEPEKSKRHILSHDTIEAALMRKAGYDVWLAYSEIGSYEEGPPNLSESLKRDRRWCQGNLQHFWFLFAPRIDFSNRIHIWNGLMAYGSSPLWLGLIITGSIDIFLKHRVDVLSALPVNSSIATEGYVHNLMTLTICALFIPKVLGFIMSLPHAKKFGGVLGMTASALIETVISFFMAPVLMIFYSKFVFMTLVGLKIRWTTQNRDSSQGTPWGEAVRSYAQPTFLGIAGTAAAFYYLPAPIAVWLMPIFAGWMLAIPLAVLTSYDNWGRWCRRRDLFIIPEETGEPLKELLVDATPEAERPHAIHLPAEWTEEPHSALRRVVRDPYINALHVSLLRLRKRKPKSAESYLGHLRTKLLEAGPDSLSRAQIFVLLWDASSLLWLHEQLWRRPAAELHPWWQKALHHYHRR